MGSNTFSLYLFPSGEIHFKYGLCDLNNYMMDWEDPQMTVLRGTSGISPGNVSLHELKGVRDFPSVDFHQVSKPIFIMPDRPIYQAFALDDRFDLENQEISFLPFNVASTLYTPFLFDAPYETFVDLASDLPDAHTAVRTLSFTGLDGWPDSVFQPFNVMPLTVESQKIVGLVRPGSPAFAAMELNQGSVEGVVLVSTDSRTSCVNFTEPLEMSVIPLVRSNRFWTSTIRIANPTDAPMGAIMFAVQESGPVVLPFHILQLKPHGCVNMDFKTLYPGDFDGSLVIYCSEASVSGNLMAAENGAFALMNATDIGRSTPDLVVPHVVEYPGVFHTEVRLYNGGGNDAYVTVTPYTSDGIPLTPVQAFVEAGRPATLSGSELGVPESANFCGWVRIASPDVPLQGVVTIQMDDLNNIAVFPLQAEPWAKAVFPIAMYSNDDPPLVNFDTGVVLTNPGLQPADATLSIYMGGALVGQTTVSVPPGAKMAKNLSELFPLEQSSGFIGFL